MATLISQWRFENGYTDSVGSNGMTAAGSGNSFISSDVKEGLFSLSMNGSGYASKSSPAGITTGNADRTMAYWVFYNSVSGYAAMMGTGGVREDFKATPTSTTTIRMDLGADSGTVTVPTLVTKRWYHFTHTYTAATKTSAFYLNGVYIGNLVHSGNSALAFGTVRVGTNENAGADYLNGYVDDVRVYNGVLTTDEIVQLASMPRPSGSFHNNPAIV